MPNAARLTRVDVYRTVTSVLMVILGLVIVGRTLASGVHLLALLVGLSFTALGVHRLSFVIAYFRRAGSM